MRKIVSLTLTLAMMMGLAACGDKPDTATTAESTTSAVTEAATSEAATEAVSETASEDATEATSEDATEASTEASAAGSISLDNLEQHTLTHEGYGITIDYAIPLLDAYSMKKTTNPTVFSTFTKDSYYFGLKDVEDSPSSLSTILSLELYSVDDSGFAFAENDKYQHVKTDNGYDLAYKVEAKEDDKDGDKWDAYMVVYGESYWDALLEVEITANVPQTEMSEEDFEKYVLAVANSVKFVSWDENTLKSDAGWEVYTHNLTVPEKVTVAGQECDVKMVTSQCFPLAQIEFDDGDLKYTMNTDRLSYNNMLWDNTQKKADEFLSTTIAGHDAYIKFGVGSSLNATAIVFFSDEHVEQVQISASTFADGTNKRDDVRFSDYKDELTSEDNADATLQMLADYIGEYVQTWTIEDAE